MVSVWEQFLLIVLFGKKLVNRIEWDLYFSKNKTPNVAGNFRCKVQTTPLGVTEDL